jgi:hypothetical protein
VRRLIFDRALPGSERDSEGYNTPDSCGLYFVVDREKLESGARYVRVGLDNDGGIVVTAAILGATGATNETCIASELPGAIERAVQSLEVPTPPPAAPRESGE